MADRPTIHVPGAPGTWGSPWPTLAELERVFPGNQWTLVGGLMAQLHAISHNVPIVRPTNDIDILLHIESGRGRAATAARALNRLGFTLRASIAPTKEPAHRYVRGADRVDVITSQEAADVVDVLTAEHAAPRVQEKLEGHPMVTIEGGTQALRRTINARLTISSDRETAISVPDVYGAIILKSAAHMHDRSASRDRHLADAAVLLACIEDPYAEHDPSGSDHRRLHHLKNQLMPEHAAWLNLGDRLARQGHQALLALAPS